MDTPQQFSQQQPPPGGGRPRLVRSSTDSKLGGVAAGLATHFGVDPLWVRLGFIALVIPGGFGILLYLVLWACLPDEAGQRPMAEGLLERLKHAPSWVPVVLVVGAVLFFFGTSWWGAHPFTVFWALALIAAGIWLYHNDTSRKALAPRSPAPAGPPVGTSLAPSAGTPTGPSVPPAPAGSQAVYATPFPPAFGGYGSGVSAPTVPYWTPPRPSAAATAPLPEPKRERSPLGRITIAVALVALGVLGAFQRLGVWHPPFRDYPGLALLVIGAGLLVGMIWGRARLLILVGLLIIPVGLVSNLTDMVIHDHAGEFIYTPFTPANVRPEYHLGAGHLRVDLTRFDWTPGTTVRTRILMGAGNLEVVVPDGVAVKLSAHVGGGVIQSFGRQRDGLSVDYATQTGPSGGPLLVLRADASFGRILIIRPEHTGSQSPVPTPAPSAPVVPPAAPPAPAVPAPAA